MTHTLKLGKKADYKLIYTADILDPISRDNNRKALGINLLSLPFYGYDIWQHYEVSWLNLNGKPEVALAQIIYNCNTDYIIESKSFKLYFNSLNSLKFKDLNTVENLITKDLRLKLQDKNIIVKLFKLDITNIKIFNNIKKFSGILLDNLDISCNIYQVKPELLELDNSSDQIITESLYTDLLKSNCPITNQPDWGSLQISYSGKKINHASLLKYIISYREHNEFHEQCIERIFIDIMKYCQPNNLTVYGRFTRRGGMDISPYRTTDKNFANNLEQVASIRLIRQ